MMRLIGSVMAGLVTWGVVVTVLNFGLRAGIPSYHAAEVTLQFTSAMKAGRLVEAAISSLAAGAITRVIAPLSRWAPWVVGLVLLALFVPEHVRLWDKFPLWYHLSFLVPLAPLVVLGAAWKPSRSVQPQTAIS